MLFILKYLPYMCSMIWFINFLLLFIVLFVFIHYNKLYLLEWRSFFCFIVFQPKEHLNPTIFHVSFASTRGTRTVFACIVAIRNLNIWWTPSCSKTYSKDLKSGTYPLWNTKTILLFASTIICYEICYWIYSFCLIYL